MPLTRRIFPPVQEPNMPTDKPNIVYGEAQKYRHQVDRIVATACSRFAKTPLP